MRLAASIAALTCATSLAFGQTPSPNAIGMWRSDDFSKVQTFNLNGVAAGGTGTHLWTVLPPDVLTYFRSQGALAKRELDFRGISFYLFCPTAGGAKQHNIPKIELRRAVQAAAPNQGRWVPSPTAGGLLLTFNAVSAGTLTANNIYAIDYMLPVAWQVPTGVTSVVTPSSTSAGDGLCLRMVDYLSQYGSGTSVQVLMTTHESAFPAGGGPMSGITTTAGGNQWMDTAFVTPLPTHEWLFTFYFDQSMITPTKNTTQIQAGGLLPGTTQVLPPVLNPGSGFAVSCDDGRGALYPKPGEIVSWSINSNVGAKLGPTGAGQVWLIPFMMFEGDVLPSDPAPENWVGNNGVAQPAYIYPMPLKNWLNDLDLLLGTPSPTLGNNLNPNNSTLGLWLGVDLANGFVNVSLLLNGLGLSDITQGLSWGGPETKAYDSVLNATGNLGRNLTKFGTRVSEFKTLTKPQIGYTPVVPSLFVANSFGLDYPTGLPFSIGGLSFYITCWEMDIASPTNPFVFNIIDMTTVLKFTLQP